MKPKRKPSDDGIFRASEGSPALVVFEDRAAHGVLRLLRPGFRHCFCLLARSDGWLLCDPLKHRILLDWLPPVPAGRLLAHYRASGRTVLLGTAGIAGAPATVPVRPLTCVEIVKRAIGRSELSALTPWRLHQALRRTGCWLSAEAHAGLDDDEE